MPKVCKEYHCIQHVPPVCNISLYSLNPPQTPHPLCTRVAAAHPPPMVPAGVKGYARRCRLADEARPSSKSTRGSCMQFVRSYRERLPKNSPCDPDAELRRIILSFVIGLAPTQENPERPFSAIGPKSSWLDSVHAEKPVKPLLLLLLLLNRIQVVAQELVHLKHVNSGHLEGCLQLLVADYLAFVARVL